MKPVTNTDFATESLSLLSDIAVYQVQAHQQGCFFNPAHTHSDARWKSVPLLLQTEDLAPEWQLVLLIALAPHLQPGFYEQVMSRALPQGGEYVEFGGSKGQHHRGILPTGETALFVLAGMDFYRRQNLTRWFREPAWPLYHRVTLEKVQEHEPPLSGILSPASGWLEQWMFGREAQPAFGPSFPARRITTPMQWADLVLHPQTLEQVNDIRLWMEYNNQVLADPVLQRKVKPGYRVLFYGPSGTGKTLTATLLGNEFNLSVYRIDLSQVVSKYIGETEKNLEAVFARASRKNWILFFDEADALFGKRTSVSSAHDKYANQEVSYLLQRIEDHEGLLILASNYKNNIDEAFLRRFHHIIHFPMPGLRERLSLWQGCIPANLKPEENLAWNELAAQYELSGAAIVNVMQYAALRAFKRGDGRLRQSDLLEGVRKELRKEEKNI